MKIDVLFTPYGVEKNYFAGKFCVIIDVLRATTSIVNALNNNATSLIPFDNIDKMYSYKDASSETPLLAGEKDTKKVEGFDLGNSPFNFAKENVEDRKVLMFTTNGTKAILTSEKAYVRLICAFNNFGETKKFIENKAEDLVILCSGSEGKFSKEDTYCAGMMVNALKKSSSAPVLTDSAEAALALLNFYGENIEEVLKTAEHGKKLLTNGFEKDIYFASKLNNIELVGMVEGEEIRRGHGVYG